VNGFTTQQSEAITGRGNVLVVAGAGTGKTHTLVARCLRLVAEEGASLENILMVTFSKAAAAEMRARLRQGFLMLQADRPGDERLAQQIALLDTARISTLHGFCLQLAREHFHELRLDPQFSVLDEQQTRPLQREALEDLLETHYNGTDAQSLAVQSLIRSVGRGSDARIRKLILKLHAYSQSLRDPARWLDDQLRRFEQAAPHEWRELFVRAVAAWRDEWLGELKAVSGQTAALRFSLSALEKLPAQPTLSECANTLRKIALADVDKNWPRGTKGKFRDPLKEFFDDAEFLGSLAPDANGNDPLAQDWEWSRPQMLALVSLVREFTAAYSVKKREPGGLDFADLEQCALQLLRMPDIAAEWRARLEHVFVDEYQDINAAQDAILTALSRDGLGNRFLVGDVKQSIYRFRLANPKIFGDYAARWAKASANGKCIPLTENFRSRETLVNFVNPLFASLMREEAGGVNYEPLKFGAPEDHEASAAMDRHPSTVEFHLIARADDQSADDDSGEASDEKQDAPDLLAVEREARLVARRLRELKTTRHQIWDKEQRCFRPVLWNDMAVLMRSPSGRAEAFAMEFNKAGVPLSAARDGFFASLEVSDLLNLLRLLDNPLQDVPLLAVLRSPLVGMSLDELAEVRAGSRATPYWTALVMSSKSNVQNSKAELFLSQFARWRELIRLSSLSECLDAVLMETHYETFLLAGERGAERVTNVRRLLDLARQFDPYKRQGLYRFLRFVQSQEDEEMDLQSASPPIEDAVRLISVHKSKGLEFSVVALAGLGTKFNERDLREAVLLNEEMGLCSKITPPGAEQSYPGLAHWLARRAEKRELRGEELRLLYVALTRARDNLILIGTTNRKADAARWESRPEAAISTSEVVGARSHLDWLLAWLSRTTTNGNWKDGRRGENSLLGWRIYDVNDAEFAEVVSDSSRADRAADGADAPGVEAFQQLKERLEWKYQFVAATRKAAKTSVSAIRRRAADEADDEAQHFFEARTRKPATARAKTGKLSAVERGTAHHMFLQLVSLERTASEPDLRSEAGRLLQMGELTAEGVTALDFDGLLSFWQSDLGRKIRDQHPQQVHRELPFTARMSFEDLNAVNLSEGANLPDGEFVVVQGYVDLAVIRSDEIWLVDFKTDEVNGPELEAKRADYGRQLRLYALALGRIYQRPVTESWLHFLSPRKSVAV
jgi:ATP-dependent helicase/nuclease subunit A